MLKFLKKYKWFILVVFFIAFVIFFKTVLMINYIPSPSMEPTIMAGDLIITKPLRNKLPSRNQIVVFLDNKEKKLLVKRIIGIPNDKLKITEDEVYINGELVRTFHEDEPEKLNLGDFVIPPGSYFVMGDNTNKSTDSRYFDEMFIKEENIKGTVLIRLDFKNTIIK